MLMDPGVIAVWQKWEQKFPPHFSHNAIECTSSMSLGEMVGQREVGWLVLFLVACRPFF